MIFFYVIANYKLVVSCLCTLVLESQGYRGHPVSQSSEALCTCISHVFRDGSECGFLKCYSYYVDHVMEHSSILTC